MQPPHNANPGQIFTSVQKVKGGKPVKKGKKSLGDMNMSPKEAKLFFAQQQELVAKGIIQSVDEVVEDQDMEDEEVERPK